MSLPTHCPSCGHELSWCDNNVNLVCTNTMGCPKQQIMLVESFIKKLGVENASAKSLEKWNIHTMDDLLEFTPNLGSKSETAFFNSLGSKMFNTSKFEVLSCMYYKGAGRKSMMKIFDFYSITELDSMAADPIMIMAPFPEGFKETSIGNMIESWDVNIAFMYKIMDDARWIEQFDDSYDKMEAKPATSSILQDMVFCFTGALSSMSRPEAQQRVTANGGTFSTSVTKKTTHLVTADPSKLTTKLKKAQANGVIIMGETEFIELCGARGGNS